MKSKSDLQLSLYQFTFVKTQDNIKETKIFER